MNQGETLRVAIRLTGAGCGGGHCPTVYKTNRDSLVVQGTLLTIDDIRLLNLDLSPDEAAVEIPQEVLMSLVRDFPPDSATP